MKGKKKKIHLTIRVTRLQMSVMCRPKDQDRPRVEDQAAGSIDSKGYVNSDAERRET